MAGGIFIALALAGCAGQGFTFGGQSQQTPDTAMLGRWILAAPGAPSCGMNFTGQPGAREGGVAPEGGCPEKFFLSRRWTFEQGALAINDEDNHALAQLNLTGTRFEGQTTAGTPVTLARQITPAN